MYAVIEVECHLTAITVLRIVTLPWRTGKRPGFAPLILDLKLMSSTREVAQSRAIPNLERSGKDIKDDRKDHLAILRSPGVAGIGETRRAVGATLNSQRRRRKELLNDRELR
jgi:hypothetical protein